MDKPPMVTGRPDDEARPGSEPLKGRVLDEAAFSFASHLAARGSRRARTTSCRQRHAVSWQGGHRAGASSWSARHWSGRLAEVDEALETMAGRRPSTAALTMAGARKASDKVVRIERSVLPSRRASDSGVWNRSNKSSSSQRWALASASTTIVRALGREECLRRAESARTGIASRRTGVCARPDVPVHILRSCGRPLGDDCDRPRRLSGTRAQMAEVGISKNLFAGLDGGATAVFYSLERVGSMEPATRLRKSPVAAILAVVGGIRRRSDARIAQARFRRDDGRRDAALAVGSFVLHLRSARTPARPAAPS
jgi:hypothetical protein